MDIVRALVEKLENHYWSPLEPRSYVIPIMDGGVRMLGGVGLIAHQDWAAWNLTYKKMKGRFDTLVRQREALEYFGKLKGPGLAESPLDQVVCGAELRSFITLFNEGEFEAWFYANRDKITQPAQALIHLAFQAHDRYPDTTAKAV